MDMMLAFLKWWNATHDWEFVKDSGLYETHAYQFWMAGWNAAVAAQKETGDA